MGRCTCNDTRGGGRRVKVTAAWGAAEAATQVSARPALQNHVMHPGCSRDNHALLTHTAPTQLHHDPKIHGLWYSNRGSAHTRPRDKLPCSVARTHTQQGEGRPMRPGVLKTVYHVSPYGGTSTAVASRQHHTAPPTTHTDTRSEQCRKPRGRQHRHTHTRPARVQTAGGKGGTSQVQTHDGHAGRTCHSRPPLSGSRSAPLQHHCSRANATNTQPCARHARRRRQACSGVPNENPSAPEMVTCMPIARSLQTTGHSGSIEIRDQPLVFV